MSGTQLANGKTNQSVPLRLALPRAVLRRLSAAGIHCRPEVSLEYQRLARRYVVRGVESGGASQELGRYVTFAGQKGEPLEWVQPLEGLTPNGVHAVAVAPVLTSIEMARFGHTYDLLIARHYPQSQGEGRRPRLVSEIIFRGTQGHLSLEMWGKDSKLAGSIAPEFFTRAGERQEIPSDFLAAVKAATLGTCCLNCRHAHFLVVSAPPPAS